MAEIYARAGEVVTCENGHPFARFIRDVHVGEVATASALEFEDGSRAGIGDPIARCHCGAHAFSGVAMRAHFPEGWRAHGRHFPTLSDANHG